ncbi:MAG TPA: GNAT family N-acetyltransferase [Archangium sp.]
MADVIIREAQARDDVAVGELLVEAFVSTYAVKLPEVRVTEQRKKDLRDVASKRAVAKVWVAEHEGRVVGTVALWPPGSRGSESFVPGHADLRHLAVDASHRGGAVSGSLLDAAEAWARRSHQGVCLHVRRGALGVARLYESRGYVRRAEGDLDYLPEVFLEAYVLTF